MGGEWPGSRGAEPGASRTPLGTQSRGEPGRGLAWLTIADAAALLGVKKSWLDQRTRTKRIPHLKLGKYVRFDQDELLAWLNQFRRGRAASPPGDG